MPAQPTTWTKDGKVCRGCGELLPLEQFSEYKPRNGRGRTFSPRCLSCSAQKTAEWRDALRRRVIEAYGGACACCGEDTLAFLAIDHVGGGGRKHRLALGSQTGWQGVYRDLEKRGYPPGHRVLCHNCNVATMHNRVCPHTLAT